MYECQLNNSAPGHFKEAGGRGLPGTLMYSLGGIPIRCVWGSNEKEGGSDQPTVLIKLKAASQHRKS